SILAARPRESSRRVESRDHGLEFEADVHPRSGLSNGLSRLAPKTDIHSRSNCINANPPRPRARSVQAANSKIDVATQSQTTQPDRLLGDHSCGFDATSLVGEKVGFPGAAPA